MAQRSSPFYTLASNKQSSFVYQHALIQNYKYYPLSSSKLSTRLVLIPAYRRFRLQRDFHPQNTGSVDLTILVVES